MFKKVLQSLTKSFGKPNEAPKPTAAPAAPAAEPAKPAGKAEAEAEAAVEAKAESPLKKIATPPAPAAEPQKTPEELCEITSKMSKDQIKERLKLLYRRHNRAASSLDNKTRLEADVMLDAIVAVREKNFGEI